MFRFLTENILISPNQSDFEPGDSIYSKSDKNSRNL